MRIMRTVSHAVGPSAACEGTPVFLFQTWRLSQVGCAIPQRRCPLNLRECSGDKTGVYMLMKYWTGSKYTRWPPINDLNEYTIGDVVLRLRSRRRCSTGMRSGTSLLQAVGSGVFITWELWAASFRRSRGSFMEPQKSAELHLVVSWLQLWQSGFPSVSEIGPFD